jgi:hypothetical protein
MGSLPVGIMPRDALQVAPFLQCSALGGLVGVASALVTSVVFRKQTMAWSAASSFKKHMAGAAAAGGLVGAFTSSYEESMRPLASILNN